MPAGGSALDAKLEVEFDHGGFNGGRLDVGLPYPGIPLDDTSTRRRSSTSAHVGLGFALAPTRR